MFKQDFLFYNYPYYFLVTSSVAFTGTISSPWLMWVKHY